MVVIDKFLEQHSLTEEEYIKLLEYWNDEVVFARLKDEAVQIRKTYYGNKVHTRGVIEFTNYCRNNCYYCGIRRDNCNIIRYRLTKEEIFACCQSGYALGYRTFVLQGGEDPWYKDAYIVEIIQDIKKQFPECAVTLSIGEKSYESYRKFRHAGADRYLLRHETADKELYHLLHPTSMSNKNRKQCLYNLKELGYQVGAGFMVGIPGQTMSHLAKDLVFLQELHPEMVGIGPFIPHHDTIYDSETVGSFQMTLFLLAVIRIMFPKILLPATTALGTVDPLGREKGLAVGANVVMPNLSPIEKRKLYELYDNKICTGDEAAECRQCLQKRVESVGYRLVEERGDAIG